MASLLIREKWFGWSRRAKAALPNVVGMREADALAVIGRVQNPGTRTESSSNAGINKGRVISTNPAAGVENYPDTVAVAYVVSTGLAVVLNETADSAACTGAGFVANEPVYFASIVTSTGIVINTQYYARDVSGTGNSTCKLSLTPGGGVINFAGNGSGVLVRGYVGGPFA